MKQNLYVVEWSFTQRCFHIDDLNSSLAMNEKAFRSGCRVDFVPLGVYPTSEEAATACEEFHKRRGAE